MDDAAWLAIIEAVAEIPIAIVLLYAYHRASKALEDQRAHQMRREDNLHQLIKHLCDKLSAPRHDTKE